MKWLGLRATSVVLQIGSSTVLLREANASLSQILRWVKAEKFRLPLKGDTRRHSCGRGSPSGWLFAQTRRMDACVRWHDVENAGATFNMELDRSYLRPTLTIAYTTDNAHALHSTCISDTATSYAKSCSNRVCSSNWRSDSMYTFQPDPVRTSSC